MPSENLIKDYIKGAFYHVYNRGVAKDEIFRDEDDINRFVYKMRIYLTDIKKVEKDHRLNIELIAFCLMGNHYHLLIKSKNERGMEKFMRSLITSHSMYFNRKYNRVGPVFQDRYKARLIKSDDDLVAISRYIHLNPEEPPQPQFNYPYSSIKYYMEDSGASWINTQEILNYFSSEREIAVEKYITFLGGS